MTERNAGVPDPTVRVNYLTHETEREKQAEHELATLREHMRPLLAELNLFQQRVDGDWREDIYCAPEKVAGLPSDLEKKVTALENIVCVLNRGLENLSLTFTHQHDIDQDKIDNLSKKVLQQERTLNIQALQLAGADQTLRELSYCTFDGVFVWKIVNLSRNKQDTPAIFSPAFYSSKYGYKLCLRLYLNGDGVGRNSHLSLFLVVMKGKYDALLKWPFKQKVTLMLLDQINREHIVDTFKADPKSSSFRRPSGLMNIASGCPLFCPLAKLKEKNSFLIDDTIFIKVAIDLTGL